MSNAPVCKRCGAALKLDDILIHKKMISRAATEFFCIDCLAWYANTTREEIEKYIAYLKETGVCALFPKVPKQ